MSSFRHPPPIDALTNEVTGASLEPNREAPRRPTVSARPKG
jgi:hypothetical protein